MKKIVTAILALLMIFTLSACGDKKSTADDGLESTPAVSAGSPAPSDLPSDTPSQTGDIIAEEAQKEPIPASGLVRVGHENIGYMDVPADLVFIEGAFRESENFTSIRYSNMDNTKGAEQDFVAIDMSVYIDYQRLEVIPGKLSSGEEIELTSGKWWAKRSMGEGSISGETVDYYTSLYYMENENGNAYEIMIQSNNENSYVFDLIETFAFED